MDEGKLPYEHRGSLPQQDLLVNNTFAVSWYAIFIHLLFNFWLNFSEHKMFTGNFNRRQHTPESPFFCLFLPKAIKLKREQVFKWLNMWKCTMLLLCYAIVLVFVFWAFVLLLILSIINMISKQKQHLSDLQWAAINFDRLQCVWSGLHRCSLKHMITFCFFIQSRWKGLQCNWHTSFYSLLSYIYFR